VIGASLEHLKRFWSEKLAGSQQGVNWVADNTLLSGLRVGLRETYDYLYRNQPSFAEFEAWILEKNGGSIDAGVINRLNTALSEAGVSGEPTDPNAEPVLTAADLAFWNENGYVVLHDAVPPENCRAAMRAICEFLDVDLDRPETWYRGPQGASIWIPLLHHPALWANREAPRVRRAFAQLWGREDIWINVDQTGFNPPEQEGWRFPGPDLHWDVSLAQPIPFGVQGILYLADTAANQGAFTCVPGFHRAIESWLRGLPKGADPRAQDLSACAIPIAGRAGDLMIWHQALPHGSSPNRAARPRFAQYIIGRPSYWDYNPVWR
jgi:Phytanoyl-CoA dioxygenase (PhyH)